MTDNTEIAALVGSRICHGLISPIGAVGNGLELMGLSGSSSGQEMKLIEDSIQSATARIRFYRIAFGVSHGDQMIAVSDVGSILNDLAPGSRVRVDWSATQDVARGQLRLAFLALMCLETALPLGGVITVAREADQWSFCGEARKLRVDHDLWAALSKARAPQGLTPATVQFGLLAQAAQALDRRVALDVSETRLLLTV